MPVGKLNQNGYCSTGFVKQGVKNQHMKKPCIGRWFKMERTKESSTIFKYFSLFLLLFISNFY
uniref:Candidate secreted effector n=1 Tax=Meloidogyne incognita TaxID=6306 RepID=A0A914KS83_MELIC